MIKGVQDKHLKGVRTKFDRVFTGRLVKTGEMP